jgi:hypothetical protein
VITRQDVVDAIAEIEPNVKSYADCQKLAVFKTLLNSYDNPTTTRTAPVKFSSREEKILAVFDELMDVLEATQPRLYRAVLQRIE